MNRIQGQRLEVKNGVDRDETGEVPWPDHREHRWHAIAWIIKGVGYYGRMLSRRCLQLTAVFEC